VQDKGQEIHWAFSAYGTPVPLSIARFGPACIAIYRQAGCMTPQALPNDNAIVVGYPTRCGRMPSKMVSFLDQAGGL
jgi:NAD(P)H dehydrogenase (quinone)